MHSPISASEFRNALNTWKVGKIAQTLAQNNVEYMIKIQNLIPWGYRIPTPKRHRSTYIAPTV